MYFCVCMRTCACVEYYCKYLTTQIEITILYNVKNDLYAFSYVSSYFHY